jgi:LacI family transcriptional regulator
LTAFSLPIVLLDREIPGLATSSVLCDHAAGVNDAVSYLLSQGHTRIAFISGPENIYVTRNRMDGYEKAFKSAKVPIPTDLVKLKDFSEKFAKEETLKLFKLPSPPTAILAGGIGSSGGVLHALKDLNKSLETDVKFVALDEWPFFDLLTPHLSSVYRDPEIMGKYAAKLMQELIEGGSPKSIIIPTTFRNNDVKVK